MRYISNHNIPFSKSPNFKKSLEKKSLLLYFNLVWWYFKKLVLLQFLSENLSPFNDKSLLGC